MTSIEERWRDDSRYRPVHTPAKAPAPNWANQTIWTGDNLDIMRGMNSGSVDLIYLDPPFNSNRTYEAPIGSEAAGAAFKDTWALQDVDLAWHGEIAEREPALYSIIDAAGLSHGKGMKAYLIMMAVRLLEMRRILADTGSIYLHCDPTASHYLKGLMDAIFGAAQFRNEIVWKRTAGRSDAKRYGRVHDLVLYYARGDEATWNTVYLPHDPAYVARAYRHDDGDGRGRWRSDQLTASGLRSGESGAPWRGVDPSDVGRHWATPVKGGISTFIIERGLIDGWPLPGSTVHERLDALDAAGMVHWPTRGKVPSLKRYLASTKGNALEDVFADIGKLEASAKEKVGYPTQKPLALLDRIIRASSNEGDVVLDPFCGCATACVAAEKLERQWVGIDVSPKAADLVRSRLQNEVGMFWQGAHREDVPARTDLGELPRYNADQNKRTLYGRQEGQCNGCLTLFPYRNMTVDHVVPQAKGGGHHLDNLQLLCGACNSAKGTGTQEALVAKLQREGIRT